MKSIGCGEKQRMAMNIKEIKQLIRLMVDNDLSELDIASGEEKVTLKRGPGGAPVMAFSPTAAAAPEAPSTPAVPAAGEAPGEDLLEIKSPMVGTFYSAQSPDSDPFAGNGDPVSADTTVCIIEAMKVMNEIKAECAGVIAEVCVKNAQPVEFGQVLFRVRPN
jgi:acetyl-CoA carboxylase biotin carboxyl carrier protein